MRDWIPDHTCYSQVSRYGGLARPVKTPSGDIPGHCARTAESSLGAMDPDDLAVEAIDLARERARPLRHAVERGLGFYQTVVGFRNAVEQMQARHGRLDDPDHRWWGFGDLRRDRDSDDPDRPPRWYGDDGLAGSRVPKRPPDGSGEASAELEEPRQGAVA